ncbi:MAG: transcriptional repressor, partial [Phycisphaerales bacterium]|nr:transcriptional repressor [Phycisphaerales bacterium]
VNRSGDARVSLATVYNTLDVLVEAGLCRKLATTNGCSRYDADMSEHLHVRFRETGEMIDVPEELGDRLVDRLPHDVLRQIEVALGIRIDGLSIQILAEPAEAGAKSARRDEVA